MDIHDILKSTGKQIVNETLKAFLEKTTPKMVSLGESELKAIFKDVWFEFYALPKLDDELTPQTWLLLEDAATQRLTEVKLIMSAKRTDAKEYAEARNDAIEAIGSVVSIVTGVLSTSAVTAIGKI